MSRATQPLGLRREVLFFLPTAVFLLVVIACFDLLVYRNAVRDIEQERLREATMVASRAAAALATGPAFSAERLEPLAPGAVAIAVRTADAQVVARRGTPLRSEAPGGALGRRPARPTALGPREMAAPVVTALAPFERGGRGYYVQVEFAAERLAAHAGSLGRILWLNVALLGTLTLLVLLFLRRLLAPYESLLAHARRLADGEESAGDETAFLVRTFERALASLEERQPDNDDIVVLERTLAPSLESGFMLLDRDGSVLSLNRAGAALLGVEPPAGPTALADLLADEPALAELLGGALDESALGQRRECRVGPAGAERILGLTVHALRRADRSVRGFIVLFADLTRIQAQARQDQISRNLSQLGEIAAGVAHEMRNGLGTLKGYLTLIEQSGDPGAAGEYLSEIRSETAHLERVLADFLSFARPGSLRSERLDLVDLVSRATADPALGAADFEIVSSPDRLELTGDRQLLDRALRNLLQNALEAQRASGATSAIGVRLERHGELARIEVSDAGDGLPDALRDALFQPFVSGRPNGVGLGLALAHRIAALHEGVLEIEDRPAGGVVARLSLPVTIDT